MLTSASFAKTEAILGTKSRLEEILSSQKSPAPFAVLKPASFSRVAVVNSAPIPAALPFSIEKQSKTKSVADQPDVFGSVALRVRHTSLDGRWQAAAKEPVRGAAAGFARSLRDLPEQERAAAINRYVNRRVTFMDDERQYHRQDLWSAASATLESGRGDCEDYAIAKLQMLRAAGMSGKNLYLVIVKDLARRADHAVLVVRTSGGMLMLDNGSDAMLDARSAIDYRPVLTFSTAGTWTHGYRRPLAPLTMAENVVRPLSPAAAATSISAP